MKKNRVLYTLILFVTLLKQSTSQVITISGDSSVIINSTEIYIANFIYTLDQHSIIYWNVVGGEILNQNIYPNNGVIYCEIQWNNTPCSGIISIYEDMNNGFAEKSIDVGNFFAIWKITGEINNTTLLNCIPITNNECNFIQNNNLIPTIPPYDENNWNPFVEGLFPNWVSTHGTPHLFDGFDFTIQAPPPAVRFGYMWTKCPSNPGGISTGEGIAQKIKPLIIGNTYNLSFFIRYSLYLIDPSARLDHFYVYLIHCYDYNNFPLSTFDIPSIPINSQLIFDGTNINNTTWEQRQVNFTANDSYDMIWFFPKQSDVGAGHTAGINFAYPILNTGNRPLIFPEGPIVRCVQYETGPWLTLTTNLTNNLQWLENGVEIAGQTSSSITLNNNPSGGVNCWPNCSSIITVKDLNTGCISNGVSITRKNFSSPQVYLHPSGNYETPTQYCSNQIGSIQQVPSLNSGTKYWWNVFDPYNNPAIGITISPNNSFNPTSNISFTGYPFNTATIEARALDNGCDGDTENPWRIRYSITIDQNCRIGVTENTKNSIYISAFPNPASSNTTITSNLPIYELELYDLNLGIIFNKIKLSGTKTTTLDLYTLKSGIYILKIISKDKSALLKLYINK